MQIKLLVNLLLSLIGILIFYLVRRIEINRKIRKVFLKYWRSNISIKILKNIYKYMALLILFVILVPYYLVKSIDRKINTFVNGKSYEKYVSRSKSSMKSTFDKQTFLQKYISFYKIVEDKLTYEYKEEDKKSYNSVSDMVIDAKSPKNDNIMIVMFVYVIINYCFIFFNNIDMLYVLFLTVLIWLILFYQILLIYRNRKGYYGTNYDEAREIIFFIKQSSNDNIDKFGRKGILNEVQEDVSVTSGEKVII